MAPTHEHQTTIDVDVDALDIDDVLRENARLREQVAVLERTIERLTAERASEELHHQHQHQHQPAPTESPPIPYQRIFDAMPIGVVLFRTDGLVVAMNRENQRLLNATEEEVSHHHNIYDDPEAKEKHYLAHFERSLRGETSSMPPTPYNTVNAGFDGRINDPVIWTETTYVPLADEHGSFCYIAEFNIEVTQREQAETRLRQSEESLRVLLNGLQEIALLTTTSGDIIQTNDTFAHMLQTSVEKVVGANLFALLPPEQREQCRQQCDQVLRTRKTVRFESTYQGRYLDITVYPVRDDDGSVSRLAIFGIDVTHYRRDQEKMHALNTVLEQQVAERTTQLETQVMHLCRTRDLLRDLFDGLDEGLLLLDGSGRVLAANQALADMLGNTPKHIVGQNWSALHQHIAPGHPHIMEDTLRTHARQRYQDYTRLDDGTTRVLDIQTIPVRGLNQSVAQVIVHMADVTERIQLDALLMQNERFVASGRLAASVAHEIRTPLQSVMMFLYMVEQASGEQQRTYLALVRDEIDRINQIVDHFQDLYRPNSGTPHPLDINALIRRVLLLTRVMLQKRRIQVTQALSPELLPMEGNPNQLTQVLLNLILNAADAMKDGGNVRLSTWVEGTTNVLTVSDTGIGMHPDIQQHIFTPFFTTRDSGSGLGLSICQRIILQHNGTITVHSQPSAGTTFTIRFPVASEPSEPSEPPEPSEHA